MIKTLKYLLSYLINPLSFLVPRRAGKIAFGSYRGGFDGNAKYLFIEMSRAGLDAVWLSQDRKTVSLVRSFGLKAESVLSPRGAWRALRSRTWFVNAYTSDILWAFSGGAEVINLWHGVGLKRTEFNSTSGPMYDRYIRKTFRQAFFHPEAYRKPQWLVTASDFQTPMFAAAFRLSESRCIKCGYPRNSILTCSEADRMKFIGAYEPESTKKLLKDLGGFREVWIYMPTWRDSQRDIFARGMDMGKLQDALSERGAVLLLKPHPNTLTGPVEGYSNIILLDSSADVYPILPYTDALITDYSSVLYDYILMEGKGAVLYLYDRDDYVKDRDFYFPFDENVIGQKTYSFGQLLDAISQGPKPLDESGRAALARKFWDNTTPHYDFSDYLHLQ